MSEMRGLSSVWEVKRMSERDEALAREWETARTLVDIGRRFGMSASSVRTVYERLAKAGRIPSAGRPHVTRGVIDKEDIRIGADDPLLARLRSLHAGGERTRK
jgi:hypothetical protein